MPESTPGNADPGNAEATAQALRLGMRQLTSGVCIMTANDPHKDQPYKEDSNKENSKDGRLPNAVAMTVSSVSSLSDAPASLLVCVNQDTRMSSTLAEGDMFAVNVLAKGHEDISTACAMPEVGNSRFASGAWANDKTSHLPYLEDAPVVFFCTLEQVHEYGTHKICIGRLSHVYFSPEHKAADVNDLDGLADLLLYARGGYHLLNSSEIEKKA